MSCSVSSSGVPGYKICCYAHILLQIEDCSAGLKNVCGEKKQAEESTCKNGKESNNDESFEECKALFSRFGRETGAELILFTSALYGQRQ